MALDEPLNEIPEFEESTTSGFRKIDQFYDVWDCAGLRLMENSFDVAHIAFVHRETFGDATSPKPAEFTIKKTNDGFIMESEVPVVNRALQKEVLGMTEGHDRSQFKSTDGTCHLCARQGSSYPNGLIHSIITAATPIDDRRSQIIQFCFRNDNEMEKSTADVIRFDRAVVEEDKYILEGTDYDVALEPRGS